MNDYPRPIMKLILALCYNCRQRADKNMISNVFIALYGKHYL